MSLRLAILALAAFALAGTARASTLVKLDGGYVSGLGGPVRSYRGIPYAAPPVGPLRWKPAQAVAPWPGVQPATAFGPSCLQAGLPPGPTSEDCLTLNVWTPAKAPGGRLPVLVWIHGGGFRSGSSALPIYDGGALAGRGVVVVTINYRLGLFGFLAHPELSAESPAGVSGDQGLTDMIQALTWVRANAAAFGGDPANVTVMGESSGATAVALLMASPQAKGLFAKAVALSPWRLMLPTRHLTRTWYGQQPSEQAGAALGELAALRAKPAAEILALPDRSNAGSITFQAVDGLVIPDDPAALLQAGEIAQVPLIVGSNRDEGTIFSGTATAPAAKTLAEVRARAAAGVGIGAEGLVDVYGAASDAGAEAANLAIIRDSVFTLGARTLARAASRNSKAWQYEFTRESGAAARTKLGAFHGSEIAYLFGNLPAVAYVGPRVGVLQPDDFGPIDDRLSQGLGDYLLHFLRSGDPNGRGLARWPAFKAGEEAYLEVGAEGFAAKRELRRRELDAIEAVRREGRARRGE